MANTRAQQTTLISANIPDNNEKLVTPAKVREVDNAGVSAYAFVDDDNDFTGVQTHAKEVRWHKGADLASASTLAVGATGNYHHVTGTTTITGLSTKQHGTRMLLRFNGALILTHSSALLLPTAANISVLAGDIAEFVSEGSGNWRCASYLRADGTALVGASLPSAVQYNTYEKGTSVVEAVMPWYVIRSGAPSTANDNTQGFRAKTKWEDSATGLVYNAISVGTGAAVWELSTTKGYSFRLSLSAANILSGAEFDIPELFAPPSGYAWSTYNCELNFTKGATDYDGDMTLWIAPAGATSPQYTTALSALGESAIGAMFERSIEDGTSSIIDATKIIAKGTGIATIGDSTAIVYGIARLIKL